MQQRDGILFSATDLVAYLECEHLTALDFQALGDSGMRGEVGARRVGRVDCAQG
jgi:hypothetical protein